MSPPPKPQVFFLGGGASAAPPWLFVFLVFGGYGMTFEGKMRKLSDKIRKILSPLANLTLRPCKLALFRQFILNRLLRKRMQFGHFSTRPHNGVLNNFKEWIVYNKCIREASKKAIFLAVRPLRPLPPPSLNGQRNF